MPVNYFGGNFKALLGKVNLPLTALQKNGTHHLKKLDFDFKLDDLDLGPGNFSAVEIANKT